MPDGSETAFRDVYREITPHTRLVFTFEWEGIPGHILVETVTLHEQSGMEGGARESWDRLEALLVTA